MRIIPVTEAPQRSEVWERLRDRVTASGFREFTTAARGDYSASASAYAAKVVAKRMGCYVEPPPSFWMQWGVDQEPHAKAAYTAETGREIEEVGFILPDDTDAYGGSPDGLVGTEGLVEVKCPAPETLISYHASGEMPVQYKPQVQGLLMISGRKWCDFYAWHPHLPGFKHRIEPDLKYQTKIAENLLKLLEEIKRIEEVMSWSP